MGGRAGSDHDEQRLVRRVLLGLALLAMVTVPLAQVGLDTDQAWMNGARLGVLGGAVVALRVRSVSTVRVLAVIAGGLWVLAAVHLAITVAAAVSGGGDEPMLGSGVLWFVAGLGPLLFVGDSLRRGMLQVAAALVGFVVVAVVATRGDVTSLLTHPGIWEVVLSIVLVVTTTTAVAWIAGRSADERREALLTWQDRAELTARLVAGQRRRARVFGRTAEELAAPMDGLKAAVVPLRAAPHDGRTPSGHTREQLDRVAELSGRMLDEVVERIGALVHGVRADGADPLPDGAEPLVEHARRFSITTALLVVTVLGIVGIDASRVASLGTVAGTDPHVVAAAGNRMLVVLFVAAAILLVGLPGRLGWSMAAVVCLLHPVALSVAGGSELAAAAVPAWRIAALGVGLLGLLSVVIERRTRERDAFAAEATDDLERSRRLRQQDEDAELAYAEAAHELKNPLTVIEGAARTLSRHAEAVSPPQAETLHTALVHAVDRLDQRLSAMRELARGPAVRATETSVPPAAVADVLLDAVAAARAGLGGRALDLDVRVTGDWAEVLPEDVEHVMENLLANAAAYGEPDSVIRVLAHRDDGDVVVEVANRGGGLSRVDAAAVFEPYWRGPSAADSTSGTGLGLAIVARTVQGWGGRCWCRVGGGWTRVGFTVPLASSVQASTWQQLQDQLD